MKITLIILVNTPLLEENWLGLGQQLLVVFHGKNVNIFPISMIELVNHQTSLHSSLDGLKTIRCDLSCQKSIYFCATHQAKAKPVFFQQRSICKNDMDYLHLQGYICKILAKVIRDFFSSAIEHEISKTFQKNTKLTLYKE